MGSRLERVSNNISSFRKKYYLNLFLRGTILTASLLLAYYLLANLLEYNLWLSRGARLTLFVLFILTAAYCVYRYLRNPIRWWVSGRGLGNEDSARLIGDHFPAIQDRLLNFLQLAEARQHQGPLLQASLDQKANLFDGFSFDSVVDLRENRRYLKYLAIPFIAFAAIFVINQRIITQGTERLVNFDREYAPQAPFRFIVEHEKLVTFPNEDFELHVGLEGDAIPDAAYLLIGQQRMKMENAKAGLFTYMLEKPQQDMTFRVEAAGFVSDSYLLRIVNRPELLALSVDLRYPRYIGRPPQLEKNIGNLEVPEGTRVQWRITTANTEKASIRFATEKVPVSMQQSDNQIFDFGKNFYNPDGYSISLDNEHSRNKDQITYRVEVIKDQYPQLVVEHIRDSILYTSIMLAGALRDDYGLSRLELHYELSGKDRETQSEIIPLEISTQPQQNFFYRWDLDSLHLNAGDKVHYFIEVWDNDGVHGAKSTKSAAFQFELPGDEAFKADIKRSQSATEKDFQRSLSRAKSLKESIEEAEQKLKGKQTLDWQDRKMLEDLIQQKKDLDKMIEDLKSQNKMLEEKKGAYSEQNERIREKSEQLQKLMNELLDEETKKLFQELEKMLRENQDPSQIEKMLDKMDRQEINLEKELERTLEIFKSLQYEYKVEQAIKDLAKQIEEQQKLLDRTEELTGDKKPKEGAQGEDKEQKTGEKEGAKGEEDTPEELAKEQEELEKQSEAFEKSMEELNKLGEELDREENTPSEEQMNEIQENQKQSKESLQQNNPGKSTAPQKKSIQKMKEMKEQMEGMENSMEMEIDQQNLESLRQIIHGLIKLSFDQEGLIKEFNAVQQSDPAYIRLSQNQLKVKDDAKVLEDSLLALAKKDPFLGSVVTREVGELNEHLDKSSLNIKERRKSNASADMQLSMTSINNLALMLNDHFDMMMQMLQNAMPSMKGKKSKGKKSLSEMQMKLNEQMEEIRKSGKSGRQLSEELAKMAAEQERIRRALQEMQEKMKQEGGQPSGNDLPSKMEQTELDLVNKQLTEQTIRRQKEIMTRLLESEKSMREQELDQERKGETAKDYQKEIPKVFEEYLRLKEKEVELLKTVPPKLYPYYKNEVNEYFKRLGNPR